MYVRKRPNGKYKFEETYIDPLTGLRKTASITKEKNTAATRKEAQRQLDDIIADRLSRIGANGRRDYTLHELIDAYLLDQSMVVRTATVKLNRSALRSVEKIMDPNIRVSKITAPYIRDCLLRSGQSAVTLNGRLKHIKALMRWAYETDHIEDIAFLAKLKRFREETSYLDRIEDKYLEQEQLHLLIKGMQVERWALLTRALVCSGMRPGEFYALNVEDVDFEHSVIRVTKAYNQNSKEVTPPKTRSSVREVHMQPDLYKVMYAIRTAMRRQARVYEYIPRGLFFCDIDGGYICHDVYAKYFRENCERVLGRPYTPYVLRHTHVSLLAANGMPLEAIARRVGHENSKITKAVYMHVTDQLKRRENEALDAVHIL